MTDTSQAVGQESLESIDPSRRDRFCDGTVHDLLKRLRHESPIHYCRESEYGPFWSVTRYADIQEIEQQPEIYSSSIALGGVSLIEPDSTYNAVSFIHMDPPEHTRRRRVLAPAFTPGEMKRLSDEVRRHTAQVLDDLPRGAVFDWVENVSIRLSTDMLATVFDFPWQDRDKLFAWTDCLVSLGPVQEQSDERKAKLHDMVGYLMRLWAQRGAAPPAPDLISRMAHTKTSGELGPAEFLGNMAALVVGGSETTRNTMSGLIVAFDQWPQEWEKILADPTLIPNAVQEAIRWQTPASYMRRTTTQDTVFRGHTFRKGDKVVMWYSAANRDEEVFPEGERFIADRANARKHLSFGHGPHRCPGALLAQLQVQALLEEMVTRRMQVQVAGPVIRDAHPHLTNTLSMPVRIVAG